MKILIDRSRKKSNELIGKLDNVFSIFDIIIEQEQKYKNFFIFLKEEITKTKKKYQENYKYEIEQIDKSERRKNYYFDWKIKEKYVWNN